MALKKNNPGCGCCQPPFCDSCCADLTSFDDDWPATAEIDLGTDVFSYLFQEIGNKRFYCIGCEDIGGIYSLTKQSGFCLYVYHEPAALSCFGVVNFGTFFPTTFGSTPPLRITFEILFTDGICTPEMSISMGPDYYRWRADPDDPFTEGFFANCLGGVVGLELVQSTKPPLEGQFIACEGDPGENISVDFSLTS